MRGRAPVEGARSDERRPASLTSFQEQVILLDCVSIGLELVEFRDVGLEMHSKATRTANMMLEGLSEEH